MRPIPLHAFVLVVGFEGDPREPLEHDVELKLFDDDEVPLELITRDSKESEHAAM